MSLVMSVPTIAIYMTAYDRLHTKLNSYASEEITPMIAGVCARTCAVIVTSPLELTRTRMMASYTNSGGVRGQLLSGLKNEGTRFLYSGLAVNLLRDVPFSAIYWMILENMKKYMVGGEYDVEREREIMVNILCGSVSGMITATVTNPLDVVKSRYSISAGALTIKQSYTHIIVAEGYRGLLRGLVPRVMKIAPSCALVITTYDIVKNSYCI